jgi:hypothetical protein
VAEEIYRLGIRNRGARWHFWVMAQTPPGRLARISLLQKYQRLGCLRFGL